MSLEIDVELCDETDVHVCPVPQPEIWIAGVEQGLMSAGFRPTTPRRAVLDWIARLDAPFTAEGLVAVLERQHGISSRATIYRTVDWLRETGWIGRIYCDVADSSYARMLPGHHHHIFCTECGVTLMIGGCKIEALFAPMLTALDFEVHGHVLALHGRCGQCRMKDLAP